MAGSAASNAADGKLVPVTKKAVPPVVPHNIEARARPEEPAVIEDMEGRGYEMKTGV